MENKSCVCIVGYACINETLARQKGNSVHVNRSMIKKTFLQKGIMYAGELALQNLYDLEKIIQWNYDHNIFLYRMSSDMFPWASEYSLDSMPQYERIVAQLQKIGSLAVHYKQRLTFHPGQFNVLVSPHESIVKKTIAELELHAQIMDLMGLPRSPWSKINIHLGGAYGDKKAAMDRFCNQYFNLSEGVATRLTVENDDKQSMYTIDDLYEGIYQRIRIPLVFDSLHYDCNAGVLSKSEAFLCAYETWPDGIMPIVHVSESRRLHEATAPAWAHADYINTCFDTYGKNVALMLEAKAKELAVLRYKSYCCKGH